MIEYKAGHSNKAANSLSKLYEDVDLGLNQQLSMAISTVKFDFIEVLRRENHTLPNLLEIHTRLQDPVANASPFSSLNGLLLYKGRLVVGKDSSLKKLLLKEFHETPIGGHAGIQQTYLRLAANFF